MIPLYIAVQFDPDTIVLASHGMTAYRSGLIIVAVTVLILYAVEGIYNIRAGMADTSARPPAWLPVLATAAAAILFYTVLVSGHTGTQPDMDAVVVRDGLFLAYAGLYVIIGRDLAGLDVKRRNAALLALTILAVGCGGVRYVYAERLYGKAETMLAAGKASEAKAMVLDARDVSGPLRLGSIEARAHVLVGRARLMEGDSRGCLTEADAALAASVDYEPALKLKGYVCLMLRRWNESVAAYERLMALSGLTPVQYNNLAVGYAMAGMWERGPRLSGYTGPVGAGVTGQYNLTVLARGLNKWGRYADAERAARAACTDEKRPGWARYELARAVEGQGRNTEALDEYMTVVKQNPGLSVAPYAGLVGVLKSLGRSDEARAYDIKARPLEIKSTPPGAMSRTPGVVVKKDGTLYFFNDSAVSFSPDLLPGIRILRLKAHGEKCGGTPPLLAVKLGETEVARSYVPQGGFTEYRIPLIIKDPDGLVVRIEYANDAASGLCDRNLYVRDITID